MYLNMLALQDAEKGKVIEPEAELESQIGKIRFPVLEMRRELSNESRVKIAVGGGDDPSHRHNDE